MLRILTALVLISGCSFFSAHAKKKKVRKVAAEASLDLAENFCGSLTRDKTHKHTSGEVDKITVKFCIPAFKVGYDLHLESAESITSSARFCNETYPLPNEILKNANRFTFKVLTQVMKAREGCMAGVTEANRNK